MRLLRPLFLLLTLSDAVKVGIFYLELSNSQIIFHERVAESLTKSGHDVTLIAMKPYDLKRTTQLDPKIRVHNVELFGELTHAEVERIQGEAIFEDPPWLDKRNFALMTTMTKLLIDSCEKTLQDREFFKWIIDEQFDVVFSHVFDYCMVGLFHAAKIRPWVFLSSGPLLENVADAAGVPMIPSFMPPRIMDAGCRMNFIERTKSFIGHFLLKPIYPLMLPNIETKLFRKYISPDFPDLFYEVARTVPLVMVNGNEIYEQAEPTLHKVINIGGLGMQFKDAKPLDEEYESLVSRARGVFIMSFGSIANATMMPRHWKKILMESFAQFPDHQFVMRYTANDMDSIKPSNVKLTKWMPQADLLKHLKTIGFITHAGYNSIQETILAGKPLISIALFGDQPRNARAAEQLGFGIRVDKNTLNVKELVQAIRTLIEDQSYARTAKRLSQMAAKKPIKPEELLDKWTTFLAEFKTLETLVPAGQDLTYIQYHSLDVIAFLISLTALIPYILFIILRQILRWTCWRKAKKTKSD